MINEIDLMIKVAVFERRDSSRGARLDLGHCSSSQSSPSPWSIAPTTQEVILVVLEAERHRDY
jgi:hypothetical protein